MNGSNAGNVQSSRIDKTGKSHADRTVNVNNIETKIGFRYGKNGEYCPFIFWRRKETDCFTCKKIRIFFCLSGFAARCVNVDFVSHVSQLFLKSLDGDRNSIDLRICIREKKRSLEDSWDSNCLLLKGHHQAVPTSSLTWEGI